MSAQKNVCQTEKYLFYVAVYMSRHKHLWKDNEVFPTSLASQSEDNLPEVTVNASVQDTKSKPDLYGPGILGCTYELCAGIVDKSKTLKQIALDEVYEETGILWGFRVGTVLIHWHPSTTMWTFHSFKGGLTVHNFMLSPIIRIHIPGYRLLDFPKLLH